MVRVDILKVVRADILKVSTRNILKAKANLKTVAILKAKANLKMVASLKAQVDILKVKVNSAVNTTLLQLAKVSMTSAPSMVYHRRRC